MTLNEDEKFLWLRKSFPNKNKSNSNNNLEDK